MYDLIYLAFLSDSTRVATFQLGRENGGGPHDLLSKAVGLGGAHGLTHSVKKTNGWQNWHLQPLSDGGVRRFVKKLKDTPEPTGKGNMLDNTLAMHGSASSSFHLSRNYPIVSPAAQTSASTTAATSSTSTCWRTAVCPVPGSSAIPVGVVRPRRKISRWATCSSASSSASASRPIPSPDVRAR